MRSKSNLISGFIPILILILALSLGAFGYFSYKSYFLKSSLSTPSPPSSLKASYDTSNWKTYTNSKMGIYFKYPDNYEIISESGNKIVFGFKLPADEQISPYLTIFSTHQTDKFITNCVINPEILPCWDDKNGEADTTLNVGGKTATNLYIKKGTVDSDYRIIQFENPNIELQMNISGGGLDRTFDQILSTFRFLDQNMGDANLSWTAYKNTKLGFSINYPSGWRVVEAINPTTNFIGFGPRQIGEDVLWAVNFYSKPEFTLQKIINDVGTQFADRKQAVEDVTRVGSLPMKRVITTTNQYPDWYHVSIVVETNTDTNNGFYVLSNGAIMNKNLPFNKGVPVGTTFEQFYESFRLIN